MGIDRIWKRRLIVASAVIVVFLAAAGGVGWYKLFREIPQQPFDSPAEKFMYGSLGAEMLAGVPYPLFVALPRVFGDLMPGPGGFAAFGFAWEEGKPLPAGFSLKTVGFPRVGVNCAICHTATWRSEEDSTPHLVPGGPGHTANPQAVLRFLSAAAHDPRWDANIILAQIAVDFDLSWLDILLYRFLLIPAAQQGIFLLTDQFAWMEEDRPDWGPGRDDPMNLTKFNLGQKDWDDTTGNADFPSIWNLGKRRGHALNWCGETLDAHAVLSDSAMGLGLLPVLGLEDRVQEILAFLEPLQPPPYPFPIDAVLATAGEPVYQEHCADCHAFEGSQVGTVIPIDRIKTDRERFDTWQLEDANKINRIAALVGSDRRDMTKQDGYLSMPLDGIWLRAPYFHNGAVPTLRDLLAPPSDRPVTFYRGYNVYDPVDMGFVSQGEAAMREGFLLDTRERGNGKGGHLYGTELPDAEKVALLEYLKTL